MRHREIPAEDLFDLMDECGVTPERFSSDYGGFRLSEVHAWLDGDALIPLWAMVGVQLCAHDRVAQAKNATLADLLAFVGGPRDNALHSIADVIGKNPSTVKGWSNGRKPIPPYFPVLAGRLLLPGGMSRARVMAARYEAPEEATVERRRA